jgi:hypothetical protein
MSFRSSLTATFFGLACFITSFSTFAAEPTITKRIELVDKLDTEEGLRVLVYSDDFRQSAFPSYYFTGSTSAPPGSNAAGVAAANLVVSLIVKGINESRERDALQFHKQLAGVFSTIDIRKLVLGKIEETLRKTGFDKIAIEEVREPSDLAQPSLLIRIQERNILTLNTKYSFDPSMRSMHFLISASLWKKDIVDPVYYTELQYSSDAMPDLGSTDLRAKWIADDGKLIADFLHQGIEEVARMLAADLLSAEKWKTADIPVSIAWHSPVSGASVTSAFYPVEEQNNRIVGRPYSPQAALLLSVKREQK